MTIRTTTPVPVDREVGPIDSDHNPASPTSSSTPAPTPTPEGTGTTEASFDAFVADFQRTLVHALVAAVGMDRAHDAAATAFAYAWEHWDRVAAMDNPRGYLYRTGVNAAKRRQATVVVPLPVNDRSGTGISSSAADHRAVESGLLPALHQLTEQQRTVVYLVEGYGLGLTETATLLDLSVSTVRNHLARGVARLRTILEVTTDDR